MTGWFSARRSKPRCVVAIALIVIDVLGLTHQTGTVNSPYLVVSLAIASFALGREVGL